MLRYERKVPGTADRLETSAQGTLQPEVKVREKARDNCIKLQGRRSQVNRGERKSHGRFIKQDASLNDFRSPIHNTGQALEIIACACACVLERVYLY